MKARKVASPKRARGQRRYTSNPKLHQVTFCNSCGETIPARALTCFQCGAKQRNGEPALQVVFCDKCGKDYPAKAMACFHCGQINARHPYLKGHIST